MQILLLYLRFPYFFKPKNERNHYGCGVSAVLFYENLFLRRRNSEETVFIRLCSFCCAGDVSIAQNDVPEAVEGRFAFPADVRTWHHSNSKVILDKNSPLYGFQQIYVNDTGFNANQKGGPYPDGSQLIVGFYEPVEERDAVAQGNVIWYAAMKKDSAAAPETGGWIMDGFDGKKYNSVVEDLVSGCFNCHTVKKDKDYVFSEYVP